MASATTHGRQITLGYAVAGLLALAVLAALMAEPAEATTFIAYSKRGCKGKTQKISACGDCHRVVRHGGYRLIYTGQPAALFSSAMCMSEPGVLPERNISSCYPFGGDALIIRCN